MSQTIWPPVFRTVLVITLIILSYFAIQYVLPLVYPFLLGWLFAWMMNPTIKWLVSKGRFPRWLAVIVALLFFVSIFFTFITLVVSQLVIQIGKLLTLVQGYLSGWKQWVDYFMENPRLQAWFDQIYTFYGQLDGQTKETISTNVQKTAESLATFGQNLISNLLSGIVIFLSTLPNIATVLVIAILASFFIALDWFSIRTKIQSWTPDRLKITIGPIMKDLKRAMFGFIKAQFILISITAVIVIIGLFILGVEYAFTIGLITGLVDLLPYLGTGAIMIPWIAYLFITGSHQLGIGLSILYGIIIVIRQILEPRVLASTVGLDPLLTLIALFIGLQLFGFLGLIIGPVTIVVLGAFARAHVFEDLWLFIREGKQGFEKKLHLK
jgi:sporulation integral membrane protein YtvI